MTRKYRPSNGAEGDFFMQRFCYNCTKDDVSENILCDIIALTMAYDVGDKQYPGEWVYKDGHPICTAFEMRKGG